MKKFRFPRGINRVNIPFILTDFSPWQEQVEEEMERIIKKYGTSKSSDIGYKIENGSAMIYYYKIK